MTTKNDVENDAITDINDGYFDDAIRQLLYLKRLDSDQADDILGYINKVKERSYGLW